VVACAGRSYEQFCGLARALDILGERWTLLLVRELLLGEKRFTDLLAALPGLTTNLLSARLRDMTVNGIIAKTPSGYAITSAGRELEVAMLALGRWGFAHSGAVPLEREVVNIGWGLFSLRRRYKGGIELLAEFLVRDGAPRRNGERLGAARDRRFALQLGLRDMVVTERVLEHPVDRPDVALDGALGAYQAWLFRDASAAQLVQSGALTMRGDARAWKSLRNAFEKRKG
jgi:DNA-binding HxlR family transcriptional regulator